MFGGIGKALSKVGKGIGKAAGAMAGAGGSRMRIDPDIGKVPLMPDCGWGGPKKTGMAGKKLLTSRPLGSKR